MKVSSLCPRKSGWRTMHTDSSPQKTAVTLKLFNARKPPEKQVRVQNPPFTSHPDGQIFMCVPVTLKNTHNQIYSKPYYIPGTGDVIYKPFPGLKWIHLAKVENQWNTVSGIKSQVIWFSTELSGGTSGHHVYSLSTLTFGSFGLFKNVPVFEQNVTQRHSGHLDVL